MRTQIWSKRLNDVPEARSEADAPPSDRCPGVRTVEGPSTFSVATGTFKNWNKSKMMALCLAAREELGGQMSIIKVVHYVGQGADIDKDPVDSRCQLVEDEW